MKISIIQDTPTSEGPTSPLFHQDKEMKEYWIDVYCLWPSSELIGTSCIIESSCRTVALRKLFCWQTGENFPESYSSNKGLCLVMRAFTRDEYSAVTRGPDFCLIYLFIYLLAFLSFDTVLPCLAHETMCHIHTWPWPLVSISKLYFNHECLPGLNRLFSVTCSPTVGSSVRLSVFIFPSIHESWTSYGAKEMVKSLLNTKKKPL